MSLFLERKEYDYILAVLLKKDLAVRLAKQKRMRMFLRLQWNSARFYAGDARACYITRRVATP